MRVALGPEVLDVLVTDDGSAVVMVGTNVLVVQGAAAAVVRHVAVDGVLEQGDLAGRLESDLGAPGTRATVDVVGEILDQLLSLEMLAESPVGDGPGVTSG